MLLTNEIYGSRGSHTLGLWMLMDIEVILKVFVKISHTQCL